MMMMRRKKMMKRIWLWQQQWWGWLWQPAKPGLQRHCPVQGWHLKDCWQWILALDGDFEDGYIHKWYFVMILNCDGDGDRLALNGLALNRILSQCHTQFCYEVTFLDLIFGCAIILFAWPRFIWQIHCLCISPPLWSCFCDKTEYGANLNNLPPNQQSPVFTKPTIFNHSRMQSTK